MTSAPHESPVSPSALAELSGTVLEQRYELGRILGAGGMGAVFEARQLRLDRPVAIKVLRPAYAAEREYIQRFLREAKAASKIRHRNIVEILDYGETAQGLVYSVMEFLVGQDIQQLLADQPGGRLPWARTCSLLIQVASGLKAAHGQGVIHRDIKPANCFITDEDGESVVKLVDFGIAKLEGGERGHTLTGTAQVLGTPSYIAPELVRTKTPASPRSDIYSLGVLAYRMLTGREPFAAETVFELLRKACFEPVRSLRTLIPDLPIAVETFVLEMLAREPEQRPADMLVVKERLLALSRETLGAQAVDIPGSSALSLSPSPSVTPPWPTGEMTVTREVRIPGNLPPEPKVEAGLVEVPQQSRPDVLHPVPTEPATRAPKIVVTPTGAPHSMVHDPAASASRSGETMSTLGESTWRNIQASGSLETSRGRRQWWLALGLVAFVGVSAAGGTLLVLSMPGDATSPAETQSSSSTVESTNNEPRAPEHPEPGNRGETPPEPPGMEASRGEPAAMASRSAPRSDSVIDAPPPSPIPEPRAKSTKKTTEPAADWAVLRVLKRRIASKCAKALEDGPVTVMFAVTVDGEIRGLTTIPMHAAGPCAKRMVVGTRFRTRKKSEPVNFTVE